VEVTQHLSWEPFDTAMRTYVEEFAELAIAHKAELMPIHRWVQRHNKYVRETRPIYSTAEKVNAKAFHLRSFAAVASAFYQSPLAPYLGIGEARGTGPRIMLDPRDISIRMAFDATKVDAVGSIIFDRSQMNNGIESLHNLVEAKALRMETVGLLIGLQVPEKVELRPDLYVEPLPSSEIESFVGPFPLPMTVNRSTEEWELLIPAPVAVLRLRYDHPRDKLLEYDSEALDVEFQRFADAVALYNEVRPVLFLQRQWLADKFIRSGWSTSAPSGVGLVERSVMLKEAGRVTEAFSALDQLTHCRTGQNISLAVRRMGFTRTRSALEDILIDSVIALEALLLSDEKKERGDELAFRAALRGAQWRADLGERGSYVFDLIARAYSLRSRIVHGGYPKRENTFDVASIKLSYEDLVAKVGDLARRMGADALAAVLRGDFEMRWDERLKLLLDSEKPRVEGLL
jgi:Apea-like HEPN